MFNATTIGAADSTWIYLGNLARGSVIKSILWRISKSAPSASIFIGQPQLFQNIHQKSNGVFFQGFHLSSRFRFPLKVTLFPTSGCTSIARVPWIPRNRNSVPRQQHKKDWCFYSIFMKFIHQFSICFYVNTRPTALVKMSRYWKSTWMMFP